MTRIEQLEQKVKRLEQKICCKTQFFDTFNDFPIEGTTGVLYIDEATGNIYIWDGISYSTADAAADHGSLTGLGDDDHTQYAFLAGRASGQTFTGGTAASENLTLSSTSNATKGNIVFGDSKYDEVNNRLSLGVTTGAGRINLPDAGTTAADGIQFGTGLSNLFRSGLGTIKTDGTLWVATALSCNTFQTINYNTDFTFNGFNRSIFTANTLTGSSATSALSITQTWNTTGNPTAIFANITNTASGALANLIDLQVGGVSYFKVTKAGDLQVVSISNLSTIALASAGYFRFGVNTRSAISSPANGNILFQNTSLTDFNLHQYGGTTSSFPALKRSGAGIVIRLADDSADAALQALTLKATQVAGYISSDGSTGATGSFTTMDLKTVTVKDGIITAIV